MTRTLLLFGAGPGIGDHIAACFASQGGIEHVVLLGRNLDRLKQEDVPFVQKDAPGVKVDVIRADLSDLDSVPKVLQEVDALTQGEDVEVVYYNAARIQPTAAALDVSVQEIEEDLRIQVLALHLISQHYLPLLSSLTPSSSTSKPALLVTSSHLPWDPIPQLLSLSLVKAAQRTQIIALNRAYNQQGVHCGLISVQGVVDPKNKVLNPKVIAQRALSFWQGGVGSGPEVNLVEEE